jgi:hypothetical protein
MLLCTFGDFQRLSATSDKSTVIQQGHPSLSSLIEQEDRNSIPAIHITNNNLFTPFLAYNNFNGGSGIFTGVAVYDSGKLN